MFEDICGFGARETNSSVVMSKIRIRSRDREKRDIDRHGITARFADIEWSLNREGTFLSLRHDQGGLSSFGIHHKRWDITIFEDGMDVNCSLLIFRYTTYINKTMCSSRVRQSRFTYGDWSVSLHIGWYLRRDYAKPLGRSTLNPFDRQVVSSWRESVGFPSIDIRHRSSTRSRRRCPSEEDNHRSFESLQIRN